jgi:hypothetical protein
LAAVAFSSDDHQDDDAFTGRELHGDVAGQYRQSGDAQRGFDNTSFKRPINFGTCGQFNKYDHFVERIVSQYELYD